MISILLHTLPTYAIKSNDFVFFCFSPQELQCSQHKFGQIHDDGLGQISAKYTVKQSDIYIILWTTIVQIVEANSFFQIFSWCQPQYRGLVFPVSKRQSLIYKQGYRDLTDVGINTSPIYPTTNISQQIGIYDTRYECFPFFLLTI